MPGGKKGMFNSMENEEKEESNVAVSVELCLHQAVHGSVGFGLGIACMAFQSPQICLMLDFGLTTSLFPSLLLSFPSLDCEILPIM